MHKDLVVKILDDLGLSYRITGRNARMKCFHPDHTKDSQPSMYVELDTGAFHCFGCGYKGFITTIAQTQLGYDVKQAQKYIEQQQKGGNTEEAIYTYLMDSMSRKKSLPVYEDVEIPRTKNIDYSYYLQEIRGFTSEEIKKWSIQVVDDLSKKYNGWIYVPIIYKNKLRTYFLRSTITPGKLYGYKEVFNKETQQIEYYGYPRKDILYGLDNIQNYDSVYIFEGIFDKIWFERTRNQTLAVLGNQLSREQMDELKKFKKIVIGLDNDDPSLNLVTSLKDLLYINNNIFVWTPPLGKKDANDCSLEEMLEQIYYQISLEEFIQSERYLLWSHKKFSRVLSRKQNTIQKYKS
jgi:DNA primase